MGSLNIPFASVKFGEVDIESLGPHGNLLCGNTDKNVVVIGAEDTDLEHVSTIIKSCDPM